MPFAHKLNEFDVDGVEPTSHVLTLANVMRNDEGGSSIPREEALKNAPDHADSLFRVLQAIVGHDPCDSPSATSRCRTKRRPSQTT